MTPSARLGKGGALAVAVLSAIVTPAAAIADTPRFGEGLVLSATLRPTLFDTDYPGHPRGVARGHAGTIGTLTLRWVHDEHVAVEAGVLGRLPFAVDFEDEVGAFPLLAVVITPFGDALTMRFGSLDTNHGFHPAVVDEPRYGYARNYEELYNRSIPGDVARDLGGDPFLPVENGAQIIADLEPLRAEVFLDWQLLETDVHREKFAVGVLGSYEGKWLDAGFQYRLVHYGGQLFTQKEEVRRLGLDPKRQPTTLALYVTPKPLAFLDGVDVELPVAFIQGRVNQNPAEPESSHRGLEVGADVILFDALTLGWRGWFPADGEARYVSEDGDEIYAGPRSHRARIALTSRYGLVELSGLLDLVFADGADKVWYRTVTVVTFRWDTPLFADTPLP